METARKGIGFWIAGIIAIAALAGIVLLGHTTRTDAQGTKQLTWVITHKPITVFDKAKDVFVEEFNKDSDTKIALRILGPDDFDTSAHRIGTPDVFDMMAKGDVQIGTISLNSLSKQVPQAALFSLPYLFKDQQAVETVFGNDIGKGVLDAMTGKLPVRALAFTFSGGWLVVQSNTQAFDNASDFSGKKLTSINGGIALDVLGATGANVVPLDIVNTSNRDINESLDKYDGVETVLTRLHQMDTPKFVTLTNHALFVTSIVVDKAFYDSLSARDQAALTRAANAAAETERADSQRLADENKEGLISRGTKVIELSAEERAALAKQMQSIYASYEASIGKDLIQAVQAIQ